VVLRPRAFQNRLSYWKSLDREALDQGHQILGGPIDGGLSVGYRLTDHPKLVHELLVVREVRILRDGAIGDRVVDPVDRRIGLGGLAGDGGAHDRRKG
jgi:hypothetical protein